MRDSFGASLDVWLSNEFFIILSSENCFLCISFACNQRYLLVYFHSRLTDTNTDSIVIKFGIMINLNANKSLS